MPRTCSQVGFQPVIPLPDGTVDSVSEVVFEEDPASWQHCDFGSKVLGLVILLAAGPGHAVGVGCGVTCCD